MIALGRGALVNPDWPHLTAARSALPARSKLSKCSSPISDIKDSELQL